jgi:hypothetical protein
MRRRPGAICKEMIGIEKRHVKENMDTMPSVVERIVD